MMMHFTTSKPVIQPYRVKYQNNQSNYLHAPTHLHKILIFCKALMLDLWTTSFQFVLNKLWNSETLCSWWHYQNNISKITDLDKFHSPFVCFCWIISLIGTLFRISLQCVATCNQQPATSYCVDG